MIKIILPLLALIAYHGVSQNIEHCATVQYDSILQANFNKKQNIADFENKMNGLINKARGSRTEIDTALHYTIPVIVHVIHEGEAVGVGSNIPYAQVLSQIEVLNEDYNRKVGTRGFNSDSRGANINIEFVLATHDTLGNELAEPGVERIKGTYKDLTFGKTDLILKPRTIWNPRKYCNIWTVNFGGVTGRGLLGYAQFPVLSSLPGLDFGDETANKDGVVIQYNNFGSKDKGNFSAISGPYGLGRTTTHELGHWLGLRHIWGDGGCSVDDFCADTPDAADATFGCPKSLNGCSEPAMFQNYMDYTNDACMNIFTKNQVERMQVVLVNSPRRKELQENKQYKKVEEIILGNKIFAQYTKLELSPNPASDMINIVLPYKKRNFSMEIYNTLGELIMTQNASTTDDTYHLKIDGIKTGIFHLHLYNEAEKKIYKATFIKL